MSDLNPYENINFIKKQAQIIDSEGNIIFNEEVTFPDFFNNNDINIVASKYLCNDAKTKETSLTQMIDRVSNTLTEWGMKDKYFSSEEERDIFNYKLKKYQINQFFAFNSPVYFNVGLKEKPQGSACFILDLQDTMDSITNVGQLEARIFKQGSGSGINYSNLRSTYEEVSGGGNASGPVSFLQWHDTQAGVVRSGGTLRRSAKLACLNIDHPDIEKFISCKEREEEKLKMLRDAGLKAKPGQDLSDEVYFQNTNISVRISDKFMEAVENNDDWWTHYVKTGKRHKKYKAKNLLRKISELAWKTADPGVQFHDTFNKMHTCKEDGDIESTNPCLPGWVPVLTNDGYKHFIDVKNKININGKKLDCSDVIKTGSNKDIYEVTLKNGMSLYSTNNHSITTKNNNDVELKNLKFTDEIKVNYEKIDFELNEDDYEKGVLAGFLYADGSIVNCSNGRKFINFSLGIAEFDYENKMLNLIHKHIPNSQDRKFEEHYQRPDTCKVLTLHKNDVVDYVLKNIIKCNQKDDIDLFNSSISYQKGFVESMISFDGYVINKKYEKHVGVTQSGRRGYNVLRQLQLVLASLNIYSCLTIKNNKTSHNLIINDAWIFNEEFQLLSNSKQNRLDDLTSIPKKHPTRITKLKEYQKIVKIEKIYVDDVYDINVPNDNHFVACGIVVHNCSEFAFINNSSCNLASINYIKFIFKDDNDNFYLDIDLLKDVIATVFVAQDILVDNAYYPNDIITKNSKIFRPIGLGYSNLGATLMWLGLPYDSDKGRNVAALLTALLTGHAFNISKKIANIKGAFEGFERNKEHYYNVLNKHYKSHLELCDLDDDENSFINQLKNEVCDIWEKINTYEKNKENFRNAQVTLLAPTGSISSILGCATTGIEPEYSLIRYKRLSGTGGAVIKYTNVILKDALQNLICSNREVNEVLAQIIEDGHVDNVEVLSDEEKEIFDTAASLGKGEIHYMGHIKMLAATQPFLSGSISKCIVGDSLITTTDGLKKIDSFYNNEKEDSFSDCTIEVASSFENQKTSSFYYGGIKETLKLECCDERIIEGTKNHKIISVKNKVFDWFRLDKLTVDDYIAIPIGKNVWSVNNYKIDFKQSKNRNQKVIKIPTEINKNLAWFFGAYTADGNMSKQNWTLSITNNDIDILNKCKDIVLKEFNIIGKISIDKRNNVKSIKVSSKSLIEFMYFLKFDGLAVDKDIPPCILESSKEIIINYINGLWLDGYVDKQTKRVAICLSTFKIISKLQIILNNFGILCNISKKYNNEYMTYYYDLYIGIEYLKNFKKLFKIEPRKQKKLNLIIESTKNKKIKNNSDIIPFGLKEIKKIIIENNMNTDPKFKTLFYDNPKNLSRIMAKKVYDEFKLPFLKHIFEENIHFIKIKNIHKKQNEVYDFYVPSNNTFIANGIYNHNTINIHKNTTVDEIYDLYLKSWKMGLKCVAIYRDGCKNFQPLSITNKSDDKNKKVENQVCISNTRKKLPSDRSAKIHKFKIGGTTKGYITSGLYEDSTLGEIFVNISRQGSTLAGLMDSLATLTSMALQYGVPLKDIVRKLMYQRFEPAGFTDNPKIRAASSLVDYIYRHLGIRHLSKKEQIEIGLIKIEEKELEKNIELSNNSRSSSSTDPCPNCGMLLRRLGSCSFCSNCNWNSGSCS